MVSVMIVAGKILSPLAGARRYYAAGLIPRELDVDLSWLERLQTRPGLLETSAGLLQTRPGLLETSRGLLQTCAGLLQTWPGLLKPREVCSRPAEVCSRPLQAWSRPGQVCSRPARVCPVNSLSSKNILEMDRRHPSRSTNTTVTSSATGRPSQRAITRSISASTASPGGRSPRS